MAERTNIHWCDSSVNPVMGCDGCELANPSSPDAATCYAKVLHDFRGSHKGFASDFFRPELFAGRMAKAAAWPDLTGQPRTDKPWLDGQPRLIFISDMGDALSNGVPFDFLREEIIENVESDQGRRHFWLWLTKRPQRMRAFARHLGRPLPDNLMAMTSVTSARTAWRADMLSRVDARWTGLSCEPILGPIPDRVVRGRDWVIAGFLSGAAAETGLHTACYLRRAAERERVPFFMKQLGHRPEFRDPKGADLSEGPAELAIRRTPDFGQATQQRHAES